MPDLPDIPSSADEATTTHAFLDFQRAVLARKVEGLGTPALEQRIGASTITLGGLLSHLAFVEDFWFGYVLLGRIPADPWDDVDWDADPDGDWHHAAGRSAEELRELWTAAVGRSRAIADGVPLEQVAERERHGERPTLRWILLHMIEEYARHLGHADLLRESIDGVVGD